MGVPVSPWLLLLAPAIVHAQQVEGTVSGIVFEEGTGVPLDGVEVRVGGRSATTDSLGRFELSLPEGSHEIVVLGTDGIARPSVTIAVAPGRRSEALVTWSPSRATLPALIEEPTGVALTTEVEPLEGPVGTLTGRILNDEDGTPVAGARVYVRGRAVEAATDATGAFRLQLPEGSWELAVVANAFASQSVAEVQVVADGTTDVQVSLVPAGLALEDFYVRAPRVTGGAAALLDERRDSSNVADVIGSEQMARAGDSSAASALRRVTGLTLVGGQFVYVRGLGERYSTTLLNGANLPSPEPERRVVPLDMFPAMILSSVVVQKTFSPDMPGEFGGGAVVLRTRNIPTEPVFRIGLTGAWQQGATFTDGALAQGQPLDWLGVDNGFRGLPADLAATEPGSVEQADRFGNGVPDDQLEAFGESLNNDWYPKRFRLPPNVGASLSVGNGWSFGQDRRVGALLGLSWNNRFDSETYRRRFYVLGSGERLASPNPYCAGKDDVDAILETGEGSPTAAARSDYCFRTTNRSIRLSGLMALGVQPAKGHLIESTTVLLRNTDDNAFIAEGYYVDIDGDLRLSEARWVERMLLSQMLRGSHAFAQGDHPVELGWRYVFSQANRLEPDRRTTRYDLDVDDQARVLSNRPEGNQRFWSTTDDQTHDVAGHVLVPIPAGKGRFLELKLGGQYLVKDRLVSSRSFKFNTDPLDVPTRTAEPEDVFTPDNIEPGLARLDEITRNTDSYDADQTIWAAYGMVRAPVFDWLDLMGGVRVEHSDQTVLTKELFEDTFVEANLKSTDPLPAFVATFRPMESMQVRAGYGRTVSRPEFRELSEAIFREVLGGRQTLGNAELERATIDSVDLRWEWFPDKGDVVSVSGFFKQFTNPIEPIVIPGAEFSTTFENAPGARNYGIELEFRKHLGFASEGLRDLFVSANFSYIQSNIQLDRGVQTNQERALSGQSPWVVNAQLGYDNPDLGINAALLYNAAGPRIVEVGAFGFPDTYETPRHNLDFVFAAQLPKGAEIRLTARNLLDAPTLVTVDDVQTGFRYVQERRYAGRQIGLRLGWRL
jgi:outer membrane receptor protein involved in Fe transport